MKINMKLNMKNITAIVFFCLGMMFFLYGGMLSAQGGVYQAGYALCAICMFEALIVALSKKYAVLYVLLSLISISGFIASWLIGFLNHMIFFGVFFAAFLVFFCVKEIWLPVRKKQ